MSATDDAGATARDLAARLERWSGHLDAQLARDEIDLLCDAATELDRLALENARLAAQVEAVRALRDELGLLAVAASLDPRSTAVEQWVHARIDAALATEPAASDG